MNYPDISTYDEFNRFRLFSVQGTPWILRMWKYEGKIDVYWPDGRLNLALTDLLHQDFSGRNIEEICQKELGDWLRKEWDHEQPSERERTT